MDVIYITVFFKEISLDKLLSVSIKILVSLNFPMPIMLPNIFFRVFPLINDDTDMFSTSYDHF